MVKFEITIPNQRIMVSHGIHFRIRCQLFPVFNRIEPKLDKQGYVMVNSFFVRVVGWH